SVLDRNATEISFPGFRKTSSRILARMLYEIRSTDLTELLPAITTPTLIIHGREDNVVPVTDGLLAASKMPNASIVELDGVNHVADLEGRERCWKPLRAFFSTGPALLSRQHNDSEDENMSYASASIY